MGKTYTSAAYETMTQWEKFCRASTGLQNTYKVGTLDVFYEEADTQPRAGVITGRTYMVRGGFPVGGRFLIDGSGAVVRWPYRMKALFLAWFKCEFCEGVDCNTKQGTHKACICTCHVIKGESISSIPPDTSATNETESQP